MLFLFLDHSRSKGAVMGFLLLPLIFDRPGRTNVIIDGKHRPDQTRNQRHSTIHEFPTQVGCKNKKTFMQKQGARTSQVRSNSSKPSNLYLSAIRELCLDLSTADSAVTDAGGCTTHYAFTPSTWIRATKQGSRGA